MSTWLDDLAEALGVDPLTEPEITELLAVARDVAHRVERRITPLSTFVLGVAVGSTRASGGLDGAVATLRSLLPAEPAPEDP